MIIPESLEQPVKCTVSFAEMSSSTCAFEVRVLTRYIRYLPSDNERIIQTVAIS